MKKVTSVFLLLLFLAFAWQSNAQVNGYTFTKTTGTYTEITGGTLLGTETSDDQRFVDPAVPAGGSTTTGVGFPIGFSFTFDGVAFDRLAINNNGWISLGQSSLTPSVNNASTSGYTPIGSVVAITPDILVSRIAGLGRDLQAQVGATLRLETVGAAPNRICVIQWKNYKKYGTTGTGDSYNFQIKLYETTNLVQYVYGTMTNNATATTVQVGLRGSPSATATNFTNRLTTTDWNATTTGTAVGDACTLSSTVYPASGTTFTFTAPIASAPGQPTTPVPANLATNVPINGTLTWAFGANTNSYDLWFGPTGAAVKVVDNATAGATGSYTYSGLLNLTGYEWHVVARNPNLDLETVGATWTFTTITAAPFVVTTPIPATGAANVPLNGQLGWTFGAQTESYDLYFGLPGAMVKVVDNATAGATGTYIYSNLPYQTLYNWQVISRNSALDLVTAGPVWTFTTACDVFSLPYVDDFNTVPAGTIPPCWTPSGLGLTSWKASATTNAGGTANELYCSWTPSFTGLSMMISPALNTTGMTNVAVQFKHMLDYYAVPFTIGLKTSGNGVDWTTAWSVVDPVANVGPETKILTVGAEGGAGSSTFYLAFYIDGNTFNMDNWYIDDVSVFNAVFGDLDGYVYKFGTTTPIEGAAIACGTYSATTNAAGYYSIPNILAGTYNVTASATGYNSQTVNGVAINVGQTTTQSFGLTWANISVNPTVITVDMDPNSTTTVPVTISNTGGTAPLNWTGAIVYPSDHSVGSGNVYFEYDKKEFDETTTSTVADQTHEHTIMKGDLTDATWDVVQSFSTASASEQAVATDGQFIYTTKWNGTGNFSKYTLAGVWVENFVISTAAGIRDFAYDGTYFYGGAGAATIFILDLANKTQVGTITASASVGGVRHIAYDPSVDGFWCGNWTTLHRINRTGAIINSGPVVANVYGSAYDPYTAGGPFLWLFAQNGTTGCGDPLYDLVTIQQFSVTTNALTGVVHCATDIPGYIPGTSAGSTIAGGAEATDMLISGKFVLMVDVQQTNNLIGAYELASLENWMSLTPASGSVNPNGSQVMNVGFDSEGLENVTKTAEIKITSNGQTGAKSVVTIPVSMTVILLTEPPVAPSNPNPENLATMVPLSPTLTWTNGARTTDVKVVVSKGLAVIYETAYFTGNSINLANVPLTLDPKTSYRWRVTARNVIGTTLGAQWNFTTIGEGIIAGTVTDAFDGLPIEGAVVTVDAPAKYSATTGADGTYSIPGILEGTYDVSVTHPDYTAPAPIIGVEVSHSATPVVVNFQMNLILDAPWGLAASIENNYDVHLTWNAPGGFPSTWLHWDNGTNANSIGTGAVADFDVAIRFTPEQLTDYEGGSLTKVNFFPAVDNDSCTYTIKIWTGTTPTLVYSQLVPSVTVTTWNEVILNSPVPFNNTEELWIGYNCNTLTGYPAGCDPGPAIVGFGDMIYFGGAWGSMYTLYGLNYNWNIEGLVESVKGAAMLEPIVEQKSGIINTGKLTAIPNPNPVTLNNETMGASKAAVSGYNVYRNSEQIATNIPDLFYDDMGLAPATYSYEVAAVYPQGESPKIGPVNVTIVLGGWVSGYITDAFDGSPIEGALVQTVAADYSTTTGADGSYYLALPAGFWNLEISALGYVTMVEPNVEIFANEYVFVFLALELAPPVLTDVYQEGLDAVLLWTGNPLYSNAKDASVAQLLTSDTQPIEKKAASGKPKYKAPANPKQGGDNIATATVIPSFPYTITGTTDGYLDDYDATCPYASPGGPDVVYSYTPASDQVVNVGLCNSMYDTKLFILASDGVSLIACNDDACGDDTYKSEVTNVALVGGSTYYIVVDGYDDASFGEYELILSEYFACDIDCSPNATAEDEVCAGDEYVDNYNGGCNSVPPVFSYISNGQTICGSASTYILGGLGRRDTDWYSYTTETPQSVTFSGTAEFPLQLLLVGDDGGCVTYVPAFATAPACQTATFTYDIMPGTWYFWVGPSVFTGVPCAEVGNQYEVSLDAVDIFLPHYNVFKNNEYLATTYNTYFVDPDLALGSTNCYKVSEVVEPNRETGLSNELCVTVVCPAPYALGASVTGTSADLFWTPGAYETMWNLEWGVAGFAQGTGTMVNPTSIPYTLTGLTLGQSYSFYVQADCGGNYTSTWVGPYTFMVPLCPVEEQCEYTFNLLDTYGDGWNGGQMQVIQSGVVVATLGLSFNTDTIYTETVAICNGVPFSVYWSVAGSWPGEMGLEILDPFGGILYSISPIGSINVGTTLYSGMGNCFPVTCPAPTALTATGITQTSALLGWTPGGAETSWNIEWGTFGFIQGTGNPDIASVTPEFLLDGVLTPATTYSFYVQAVCGEGDVSFWTGPFTFNTACEAFGVPFSEGFEGTWPPTCWTNNGWVQSLYGDPNTGLEWAYSNLAGSELITPEVMIPATGDYQLSFWYRAEGASYPQDMNVLISNDGGTSWTTLESFVGITSIEYLEAVYNLAAYAGQSVWVKFVGLTGTGGFAWGVLVDDVLIDMVPPPQQTMSLPAGWSGWSSYIDPAMDAAFADVIAPVAGFMDFGQYFSSVYWPAYGINTMGAFSNAHGYVAKMNTAADLTLVGNLLAPGTINLASGWNLISVLSECDVDVTLLGAVPGFVICMEVAGTGVYWPAGSLTTLTTLVPGKAYWVKMSAAGTFTFPACVKSAGISYQLPIRPEHSTPWNAVNFTGTTHFIAISEEAARSLNNGDIVGVFNAEGVCAGMIQVNGNATTLNVFGDDITTASLDGMTDGSAMIFRVYRPSTGEVFDVTVNYGVDMPDYNGTFTTLGMSRVTGMTLNATGVGSLSGADVSIFPNPSSGLFNITLSGIEGNVEIQVVDAHGQVVLTSSVIGNTSIDLTKQPKGVYYVKLVGSSFTSIEKVVIK